MKKKENKGRLIEYIRKSKFCQISEEKISKTHYPAKCTDFFTFEGIRESIFLICRNLSIDIIIIIIMCIMQRLHKL
jgi:hypothetical protein